MLYLDSDGLFAHWRSYVLSKYFPHLCAQEFNQLPELRRRSMMREMYRREPNLFYNLPPNLEMVAVVEEAERLCIPWCILTSGAEDHFDHALVVESKQLWFDKHFGIPASKVTVTESSAQKKNFAGRGRLLVDDYGRNCREWALGGGTAFWTRSEKPNPQVLVRHIGRFADAPYEDSGCILQIP